jgi:cyclohexanecarboxylate-CoA ligase/acyl-CoA synthetase
MSSDFDKRLEAMRFPELLDWWAKDRPDNVFVSDGYGSLAYGELRDRAWRLAAALRELGVSSGDRVAVQLPNWNEFTVVYAALGRLGAVLVPIIPIYRHDEVTYILEHSEAVALFTCSTFRGFDYLALANEVRDGCASLRAVITVRARDRSDELAYEDLVGSPDDAVPDGGSFGAGLDVDAPHAIVYSSGTEARPKGCLHSWATTTSLPRAAVDAMRLRDTDVMFMPSPITHTTGLTLGVLAPLMVGGGLHLLDVWDPKTALTRIGDYRCTATASATPFIRMLLDAYEPGEHDVSSLRLWLTAGAPIPAALIEEASHRLAGCRLISAYGQSETMVATVCGPEDPVERVANSDGRPIPGVELRIVDDAGRVVGSGEEGEICYQGPGRMLGYWRDDARTSASIDADGWWHTGDVGRLDDDGYLRVTGRIKEIIIRGGQNISAREVEEHVLAHPKVSAVAVVGIPDPRLGEKACAFVVPAGDDAPTLAELVAFLITERRIAAQKMPERLVVVDALPMTASGKVQKYQLRDLISAEVVSEHVSSSQ